jgi:hypothetical protein
MSDLVFSSVCSGYQREHPWMEARHHVAGLPMLSHADCRLLEAMIVARMAIAKGEDLERLIRWQHAIVNTRRRATKEGWPGWERYYS